MYKIEKTNPLFRLTMGLLFFLILSIKPLLAEIELTIDKSGGNLQMKAVVIPFIGHQGLTIARIVEADLRQSGRFSLINPQKLKAIPGMGRPVPPIMMQRLAIDYIIRGKQINESPRSGMLIEIINVQAQRTEATFKMSFDPNYRSMAHKISDMIYHRLTGIRGAFNTLIAYIGVKGTVKNRIYELVVADYDGHDPQVVTRSSEPIMSVTWSPDSHRIAYVSFESGRPAIYIQNLQNGKRRLVSRRKGINGAPSWSPNGQYLAFSLSVAGNPEIYFMNIANGQLRRITQSRAIDTEPSWEQGGRSIVFTSDRGGTPQLYRKSIYGGRANRITFTGRYNSDASVIHSKAALVRREEGRYRIAIMDLSSHEADIISRGPLDESPSISPNGAMVVYETRARGKKGAISIVSDNGLYSFMIESAYYDSRHPSWSPYQR